MTHTHKGPSWDQLNRTLGQDRTPVQFEGVNGNSALTVEVMQLTSFNHYGFTVDCLDTNGNAIALRGRANSEEQPGTYKQL